jgi:hypothetical protein
VPLLVIIDLSPFFIVLPKYMYLLHIIMFLIVCLEVLMPVSMKMAVLWAVAPCTLV